MKIASRMLFVVACVMGAASVLLAAYVAHMAEALSPAALKSLHSALQLLQIHALAMAGVTALALLGKPSKSLLVSAGLFLAGLLMFSVNICLVHLADITVFKSFTPYGGMALVGAWLALAAWAF
jgi:uncharacterized membrane protein YgdD (TMEM256/DUF423 family)